MLDDINHPTLLQELKLNIDAEAYEKVYANVYKPSSKKEIDRHDSNPYWKPQQNKQFSGYLLSSLYSILQLYLSQIKG